MCQRFDLISTANAAVTARNVPMAAAAAALGLTVAEILDGITAKSYVDGNDLRCATHMQITGRELVLAAEAFAMEVPSFGAPALTAA